MSKQALKILSLLSILLMTACSPMEGQSLLTNERSDDSSHTLDKTPKSEELYLKSYSPTINTIAGQAKAEVSGECYISTYPNHKIVALENGVQLDIVDLNPTTDANGRFAVCKNGKFNLAINTSALAGGIHSIRLLLQAYDENGAVVVNDAQGASAITLTK
ncbi:hypothetical protein [Bdellovibrio reynosensis]|uniref:Lipoprotein n=1 Tax=Bdellovibrio reynosensis TaxID=2835041 RepID=A0ABY4CB01_9BACT|nr:hypothetical protein [Bdellovibrio reynosensis]UOF02028.1 hypothetical protein MNR06_03550 [Bdellovibrio reynosensis]